jgi:hypothetical protein
MSVVELGQFGCGCLSPAMDTSYGKFVIFLCFRGNILTPISLFSNTGEKPERALVL